MEISTITGKGQTSIPAKILRYLKLKKGDKLRYFIAEDGHVSLSPVSKSLLELEGMLPKPSRTYTLEEVDDGIAKAVSERMKRCRD